MIKIGPVESSGYLRGLEERILKAQTDALKLGGLRGKQAVQNNFRRQEDETGRKWDKTIRGGTIFQDKSGRMMKGIAVGEPQGTVIYVGAGEATADFNAAHNFGVVTKAHIIRPKNKKALAWPGGKHPVKLVHHPGSKIPRRHFMYIREQDRESIRKAMQALFVKRARGGGMR